MGVNCVCVAIANSNSNINVMERSGMDMDGQPHKVMFASVLFLRTLQVNILSR